MPVTKITDFRSKEASTVLQHLLDRALAGEVQGLAICALTDEEEIYFTGLYRTSPGSAVNAAMRMSWRMTQMQDEVEAKRSGF